MFSDLKNITPDVLTTHLFPLLWWKQEKTETHLFTSKLVPSLRNQSRKMALARAHSVRSSLNVTL